MRDPTAPSVTSELLIGWSLNTSQYLQTEIRALVAAAKERIHMAGHLTTSLIWTSTPGPGSLAGELSCFFRELKSVFNALILHGFIYQKINWVKQQK